MSAPKSIGRRRYGVGKVLSTTSGKPCSCAIAAILLDVEHVDLRIADRLGEDRFGIRADRIRDSGRIVEVDQRDVDAKTLERMRKGVVGAAVERGRAHDVVAAARDIQNRIDDRGLTACHCKRGGAAFECGHALLEHVGRGIVDAGVDVAELLERKEFARVFGRVEEIRGGLINRNGARVRRRVAAMPAVNGERVKMRSWGLFEGCTHVRRSSLSRS